MTYKELFILVFIFLTSTVTCTVFICKQMKKYNIGIASESSVMQAMKNGNL
jgi:hypothetical protein